MTFHVPAWIPADPGAPPRLPAAGQSGGQVLALVATEGAVSGGWVAGLAFELASGWSSQGAKVVLVDAGLEMPSLQESAGESGAEGLVDALRWGASLRRVAHRPAGSGFIL
ncbi:MAG: CpsD/CapB family tyrosine-protein kinase, partial [Gemmatimonadetes bacterium]|nr:CpsD/CapB family tyrosine-protein kinase [Gemmatimonadota bacterium]